MSIPKLGKSRTSVWATMAMALHMVLAYPLAAEERPTHVLKGHQSRVYSLTLSPDGETLVSIDCERMILWDLKNMSKRAISVDTNGEGSIAPLITDVCFSPDGTALLIANSRDVELKDAAGARTLRKWSVEFGAPLANDRLNESIRSIAFHPNGSFFACGSLAREERGVVFLVSMRPQLPPVVLGHHDDDLWHTRFSPNGAHLAAGGRGDGVVLWDMASRKSSHVLKQEGPIWDIAWAPEGDKLLVAAKHDIRLWDVATENKPRFRVIRPSMEKAGAVLVEQHVAFLGPGSRPLLAVQGLAYVDQPPQPPHNWLSDGSVQVFAPGRLEVLHRYPLHASPAALEVSRDGRTVIVGTIGGGILLWRLKEDQGQ